ncbi:MAG: hypothetical protein LBI64_03525 [Coriobacteriales bacterium]|jgi:hypothetical protein|nr:hypothetical protein [Coriobacteriales bacterium]
MDIFLIICAVAAVVIVVSAVIVSSRRADRRLRQKLEESFGKAPEQLTAESDSSSYWLWLLARKTQLDFVDQQTWDDLEMGSVFSRIDSCRSSLGDEWLYQRLHALNATSADTSVLENMIAWLDEHPAQRLELQFLLDKTGKAPNNGLSTLADSQNPIAPSFQYLCRALAFVPMIMAFVFVFHQWLGLVGLLVSLLVNGIIHYRAELKTARDHSAMRYLTTVLWGTKRMLSLFQGSDAGREVAQNPLVVDLAESYPVFVRVGGAISGAVQRSIWYSELAVFKEFYEIASLARIRNYNRAMRAVKHDVDKLHQLCRGFGAIDAAVSILSFRKSLPYYSLPTRDEDCWFQAAGLYHPLLNAAVPNDIDLKRASLITGSNASGKSTFIKAVGINAILAQTINTCTAQSLSMSPRLVVSAMAAHDSVLSGESYFIAETRALKRLVDAAAARPSLCLVDEILRGTNTIERVAASAAILHSLAETNSLVLAATHDLELVGLLGASFDPYHFEETIGIDDIDFDYQLRAGSARSRTAIKLLELLGFDPAIVSESRQIAENLSETD